MNLALARQQVERRQLDIGEGRYRPAVPAISVAVEFCKVQPLFDALHGPTDVDAPSRCLFKECFRPREAGTGCRANRRILPAKQLLRLDRPRHQLAIQHCPVGTQFFPETGVSKRRPDSFQELRLEIAVFKEPASGTRVAGADAFSGDAEPAFDDFGVLPQNDNRPGAHVFFFRRPRGTRRWCGNR